MPADLDALPQCGRGATLTVIEQHLDHLFHWSSSTNKFEVRCLHPTQPDEHRPKSKLFLCDEISATVAFAETVNRLGYNIYVTANPLKPETTSTAKDTDVVEARYHWIAVDTSIDATAVVEQAKFQARLVVTTGTEPRLRLHGYWMMSEPVDLAIWTQTQKALAAAFNSDPAVVNPSRIMRLAGTISTPDAKKAAKGYKPELVTFAVQPVSPIDPITFRTAYPVPQAPAEPVTATMTPEWSQAAATDGYVPLPVIAQALDAIPPITDQGRRQDWLALAMATKAANPAARYLFDQWQRQSPQFDKSDLKVWDTIHPDHGSYLKLFADARNNDPGWWRDKSFQVETWWREHIEQTFGGDDPPVTPEPQIKSNQRPFLFDVSEIDVNHLIPHRWMYMDLLVRGMVSAFCGPGGNGKSSLALAVSMSVARGRDLLALDGEESRVMQQGKVLYWNLEDPFDEIEKRVTAEMKHRNIDAAELRNKLFIASGRDFPLCVAKRGDRNQPVACDISATVNALKDAGISVLVVDPLINAHALDQNDNSHLALVLDQFRKIAHEADCAELIVQHFRKGGQGGDVEASLGAVTFTNSCRVVETVTTMTEADATALGIPDDQRRRYVMRKNAKINLSVAPSQHEWYEFRSVPLNNGTEEYPKGDSIGVLSRWKPLSPLHGLSWQQVSGVFDKIDAGTDDRKEFHFPAPQAERWAGKLLMQDLGMNKEQAKSILKEWVDAGALSVKSYNSPSSNYSKVKRLCVEPDGMENLRRAMASRA